ncbi:transposase [Oceanobacillus bengalensis]|uniref:Transposase n=1 Tax=Oceanobacillus bengalensis TaxID=1435466 RepID=A0A494YXF6_9BACI|nr:transposase [Oceanobacillus bengalensis]RKQ14800.1 transposase [Oceanobacillus bengalensis]
MARKNRIWMPGHFYHIVSRGNWRGDLFKEEADYKIFLHILREINEKTPIELASYCLMTNHYHLQLRSTELPISKVMAFINKRYADYHNNKYEVSGHVFEKRYYGEFIDSPLGMLKVSKYIHLNPLEADMVNDPLRYRWSSYLYYLHTKGTDILKPNAVLDYFTGDESEKRRRYVQYMEEKEESPLVIQL